LSAPNVLHGIHAYQNMSAAFSMQFGLSSETCRKLRNWQSPIWVQKEASGVGGGIFICNKYIIILLASVSTQHPLSLRDVHDIVKNHANSAQKIDM